MSIYHKTLDKYQRGVSSKPNMPAVNDAIMLFIVFSLCAPLDRECKHGLVPGPDIQMSRKIVRGGVGSGQTIGN